MLSTAERSAALLEREDALAVLSAWAVDVSDEGGGRLAFVCGEAGVGKTLLLRRFCDGQGSVVRVLWGSCDPLFAPRPLGRWLVRARRGDPDVWTPLDEAWALAQPTGELQRIEPAAAARAEALWLEDRCDRVADATDSPLDLAARRQAWWIVGELAYWRRCAGILEEVPANTAEPWASQLKGDWRGAGKRWSELDSPYEAALALAGADDEHALRSSFEELQRLGALPAAATVARRLRERGARGIPRGPRQTTRANPANLTTRELEVLGYVAQGLRNAVIAERLFLSEKTVDHHVSAILRKLNVRTRVEAGAEAVRLGLVG